MQKNCRIYLNQIYTKYEEEDLNKKRKYYIDLKNIKFLSKLRQANIKLFNDYSSIASEGKHKVKY